MRELRNIVFNNSYKFIIDEANSNISVNDFRAFDKMIADLSTTRERNGETVDSAIDVKIYGIVSITVSEFKKILKYLPINF